MTDEKKKAIMNCTSFDEILNEEADKIGTKKSYISKLENGHADIQLSTLFRIFAGLGKRVSLTIL